MPIRKNRGMIYFMMALLFAVASIVAVYAWFSNTNSQQLNELEGHYNNISDYFAGGNGSEATPYIISKPEHLKNMSWLQYLGYLNQNILQSNNQVHFKLVPESGDTLDMSGWTILPIGTTKYPFYGNFNGNGKTIANLTVTNTTDKSAYCYQTGETKKVHTPTILADSSVVLSGIDNIGLFGTIMPLEGEDIYFSVENLYLNHITINVKTDQALVGVLAGYAGGMISSVGVDQATIKNNGATKKNGYENLSNYFLLGDCASSNLETVQNTTIDVYQPTREEDNKQATPEEGGSGFGGSFVAIKNLFERVAAFKESAIGAFNFTTTVKWSTFIRNSSGTITSTSNRVDAKSDTTKDSGSVNEYINYTGLHKEGSASFKKTGSNSDGSILYGSSQSGTELYLTGSSQHTESNNGTIYEEVQATEGEITIGYQATSTQTVYLTVSANQSVVAMETLTEAKFNDNNTGTINTGYAWSFTDVEDGYGALSTTIDGTPFYLSQKSGKLCLISSNDDDNWAVYDNEIRYDDGFNTYYLTYEGEWVLKKIDNPNNKTFLISSGNNYLVFNGSSFTASTSAAGATRWYITPDFKVYAIVGNTMYYLYGNMGSNLATTNAVGSATSFEIAKDGELPITSINELTNGAHINLINSHSALEYSGSAWKMTNTTNLANKQDQSETIVIKNQDGTYLRVNDAKNGFISVKNMIYATKWTGKKDNNGNGKPYTQIFTTISKTTYYLTSSSNTLGVSTNSKNANVGCDGYNKNAITTTRSVYLNNSNNSKLVHVTGTSKWTFANTSNNVCTARTDECYDEPKGYLTITNPPTDLIIGKKNQTVFKAKSMPENSTYEVPDTYIPMVANSSYQADNSNDGYFVSGDNGGTGDLTLSQKQMSDALKNSNGSSSTFNESNFKIMTVNKNTGSYVQIGQNGNTVETLDLQRYKTAIANLKAQFNGSIDDSGTRVYGLKFEQGKALSTTKLASVPVNNINIADQNISGTTYQLPENCLDFNIQQAGYVNIFAGTFDESVNHFFSLYKIERNAVTNEITSIKRIRSIYKIQQTTAHKEIRYVYSYDGNEPSHTTKEKVTKLFDMSWIENPGTVSAKTCYYFEIPLMIEGEFALSSASGSSANASAPYLMYLDVGTSEEEATVTRTEAVRETISNYKVPKGIDFYLSTSETKSSITNCSSCFALNGTGTTTAQQTNSSSMNIVKVYNSSGESSSQLQQINSYNYDAYYVRADSYLQNGDDYLDITGARPESTSWVLTQTQTKGVETFSYDTNGNKEAVIGELKEKIVQTTNEKNEVSSTKYTYGKNNTLSRTESGSTNYGITLNETIGLEYAYYTDATTAREMDLSIKQVVGESTLHFYYTINEYKTPSGTSTFPLFVRLVDTTCSGSLLNGIEMIKNNSIMVSSGASSN